MATKMKLFHDPLSQPSRAVMLLLEANKIDYNLSIIRVYKGDSYSDKDFRSISAPHTVPTIDDNGFHLFESVAIMKYLISKHNLPDHWYPSDLQQRAKIDEYLHWHAGNIRRGGAAYVFYKCIGPKLGVHTFPGHTEELQKVLRSSLDMLENYFLRDTQFISSPCISIADIHAVCEFTQFWFVEENVPLSDKPRISKWLSDVQSALSPHFDEVHKGVYKTKDDGTYM